MAVRIADVISLVSDLVDFYKSAHEALSERRRRRAEAATKAEADALPPPSMASDVKSGVDAPSSVTPS